MYGFPRLLRVCSQHESSSSPSKFESRVKFKSSLKTFCLMFQRGCVTLFLDIPLDTNLSYNRLKPLNTVFFFQEKHKTSTRKTAMKCGWSKLDKIETDCQNVNLKNVGPTFSSLCSFSLRQVANNKIRLRNHLRLQFK